MCKDDWSIKGSATEFAEGEWFSVLQSALYMEELIERHSHIMDKYDPEKRIGLIVDEVHGLMWSQAPIQLFYISKTP